MPGEVSPELYARWIQYGAFSPILRTHTTKNPKAERRIWAYPTDYYTVMRDAYLLRYALIPYIYTSARETFDTGISICRPLYYDYPETKEAYSFRDEYMFGDSILVAPITAAASQESGLAAKTVWLPPGTWIEWFTGSILKGPARLERSFELGEIPVYVKAGAIIPMQPKMKNTGEKPVDPLILAVFPQAHGSTQVYEDQGNSLEYKNDAYSWTEVRQARQRDDRIAIEILPAKGSYTGMPPRRSYQIRLIGVLPPGEVLCNGRQLLQSREGTTLGWTYDGNKVSTVIQTPDFSVGEKVELIVVVSKELNGNADVINGFPLKRARLEWAMNQINAQWPGQWSTDHLVEMVQTGERMTLHPGSAASELRQFQRRMPEVLDEIRHMGLDKNLLQRILAHLHAIAE